MAEIGEEIIDATSRLARRMNLCILLKLSSVPVLCGICAGTIFIFISKFVIIPVPTIPAVTASLVAGLLAGIARGMLARITLLEAAKSADTRLGFKERLSTAVEICGQKRGSEMSILQLEDAVKFARSMEPKAVCPRVLPMTAKILPLAFLAFILLVFAPLRYGRFVDTPPAVREAIKQTGFELETLSKEIAKKPLSHEMSKLASKMELNGRDMQDKPLTKKEALKNLSNLALNVETLEMMGELANELEREMTPEKKRILRDILEKLSENLRDLQGMEKLSQKTLKAQQANLSMEALKELSDALKQMKIGASDMEALQQMSKQVAKGRQDIGKAMLTATAGIESSVNQEEEDSGLMGGTAPGKDTAKGAKAETYTSRPGGGFDSEIESQISGKGRTIDSGLDSNLEKVESLVQYEEIYAKYRDVADDAIARNTIPWIYRKQVKSYFDAIKPNTQP